jgi:transcriptional regulator with XRE-family HTH domain
MTHFRLVSNCLPLAAARLQNVFDFDVEGFFHRPILVKNSLESKEHFTNQMRESGAMLEKPLPINEVVAENLAYWMGQAGIKQAALAEKAKVSQKTISNYLNPDQRTEGSTGKDPSGKLSELDRIAKALSIEVWQLTRQMTAHERVMYEAIEKAYEGLRASVNQ